MLDWYLEQRSRQYFKYKAFAFTALDVAMLSSVLKSKTAIEINRGIMHAFVAVPQKIVNSPIDIVGQLDAQTKGLKDYIEDLFADYNVTLTMTLGCS